MNKLQQIVVWSAIGMIVLMVLFPPRLYVFVHPTTGKEIVQNFAGWWFIGELSDTVPRDSGPQDTHNGLDIEYWSIRIDITRLSLQIVPVVLIAAGLLYQFRERKPN